MYNRTARMLLAGAMIAGGCASDSAIDAPPARVDEPIGVQMIRIEPQLKNQRFNNLLGFETPDDMVFVSGAAAGAVIDDRTRAHTGRGAIRVSGGVLAIKLSSLVSAGAFPGEWTLAGAYFYAPQGCEMSISCQFGGALVAQRKLTIPPGKWTPAMVDVALLSDMKALVEPGSLSGVVFQWDSTGAVWCDDFTLINNSLILSGTQEAEASLSGPWRIQRRGLNYVGDAPGRFSFKLPLAEHLTTGWKSEEVNAKRARFSSTGAQKAVTIYSDGRAYWDGEYRPLSSSMAEPQFMNQQRSPGLVEVSEEFGRVDRNTPGDLNNDGYNESRGSYQVQASGTRLELTLSPRDVPLAQPVLEITGMPTGKVLVTVEGRVIEDVTRLDDGTLLIEIPARINRTTEISVKLQ